MNEFIFIGFNIRVWPSVGDFNVDDTGWDINYEIMDVVEKKYCVQKNEYQLLMPENSLTMQDVSNFVLGIESANVAAVKIPTQVVRFLDRQRGYKTSENNINLSGYIPRGFDICDIDGLFSVLHNPDLGRSKSSLFPVDGYLPALEFANFANIADRSHAPYILAEISTLK
jgi:hypothetical protein